MAEAGQTDHADTTGSLRAIRSRLRRLMPRWVGIGLFIYATVYTLAYAKTLLVPVVLGLLLSLVFSPLRRVFDRYGIPQALTALVIVLGLLAGLLALVGALAMPVTSWVERAPQITEQVQAQLGEMSSVFSGLIEARDRLNDLANSDSGDVQQVEMQGTSYAALIAQALPSVAGQFVFTLVLLFFLLASGDMFYEKLIHVMPSFTDKRRAVQVTHDIERKLSTYLLTITIINAGLGVTIGLLMWALGMPSPLVFGLIAFIFNYVPYLGAITGVIVATAVALVTFDWIWMAPIVGLSYFAATSIEGQFVTPTFVGRSLRLNTVVVFLAVSIWAWLWSAIGMVVAVPLLAALRTICMHVDGLMPLGDFLSERHSESELEPAEKRRAEAD